MPETAAGPDDLEAWIAANAPGAGAGASIARRSQSFAFRPRVSVLVAIEELDEIWAKATVGSVLAQSYPRVELVVAASARGKVNARGLASPRPSPGRVEIVVADDEPSPSALRRRAFEHAEGDFVTFVGHADRLAPDAVFRAVELLQTVPADVVYTDEDRIDEFDRHDRALAKPYWCPDLAPAEGYVGGMTVIRREALARALAEGAQDPDPAAEPGLIRRLADQGAAVVHLPRCAYHRRRRPRAAARGPIDGEAPSRRRPAAAAGGERVSAIVLPPAPAGGPPIAIEPGAVREIVDAGDPGLDGAESSPAAAANAAAARAEGELLLFVDGRAVASSPSAPGWLAELVALADRDGVAAVGGQVRDPEGRWLQAGLRPSLGPLSELWLDPETRPPLADRVCNPIAVCAAPMVIRRSVFESLSGFDADNLPSSLFDLDLALRASRAGLRNVYSPSIAVQVPGALPATDAELAHFARSWTPELSLIGAYDRSSTDPGADPPGRVEAGPRAILRPDLRVERIDCGLTLRAA